MSDFNSLALDVEKPRQLLLDHPIRTTEPLLDKEGRQAYVMLYSLDSQAAQKFQREATTRALRRRNRTTMTAEESEAEDVGLFVALTAGWYLVNPHGDPVAFEFTPQNARQLYSTRSMQWIREQVNAFIGDRATFLRAPDKTSENGQSTNSL